MSGRKRLIRFKINKEKLLRINYEYFRVILAEFLRIARLRSDLCNSYEKNGVVAVKNYLFHITLERMHGCNCSVKKSPSMKEWMAQADPPKEASTIKKMNDRLLLLSFASANVQKYNCSCKKFTVHND